jgi:hypothetical protein
MAPKDSDGRSNCKKRRKKQKENGPESADAASGRVTSDSLMSVRKQIMIAKAYQAYKSKNVSPVYRTSLRRQKKSAQEEGEEEEKAAVEEDTTGFSVPVLFVDGYNIIGRWARLKKRKERGDLAGARQLLLDDLLQFAPRRFEVVCVFDAYGQGELADKIEDHYGMSVVFTRDTADSYIEKETLRLSQEDMTGRAPQRVWAATSDRAIQISASVHGATVVSASWLVRELKDSRAETTEVISEFNKAQRRRSGADILIDSLPVEQQAVFESLSNGSADAALSRRERAAAAQASAIADAEARMRKPAMPPKKKRAAAPKRGPENIS